MGEEITETPKDKSLIKRITGRALFKKQEEPVVSDFEESLFENGVYHFIPEKEESEAKGEYSVMANHYKEYPRSDDEESLQFIYEDLQHDIAWKQNFSRRIPKTWGDWVVVMNDFREAGKRNVQLSETLVDAGVSHSHNAVVTAVGDSQKLNERQLVAVFANPSLPWWAHKEVEEAQKKKGVKRGTINKARQKGEEIKRRLEEKRRREEQEKKQGKINRKKKVPRLK